MKDILVVGAGFAGAVLARELADSGFRIKIIDARNHIAGNAYDPIDEFGFQIHQYGPHIFHTNSEKVFDYLSRFTEWRFYEHRVTAKYEDLQFPLPVNLETLGILFPNEYERVVSKINEVFGNKNELSIMQLVNSQSDVSQIGKKIHDFVFKDYTEKQWGLSLDELGPSVSARVPVRLNHDDRYFTDRFQFMPARGYITLFENLLNHSNISIELSTKFNLGMVPSFSHIFYSGSIDELLSFRYGYLPYRSLNFEYVMPSAHPYQGVAQVNYTHSAEKYTRTTEFHYLTGESKSAIAFEYPTEYCYGQNIPFYPIPLDQNRKLHDRYLLDAKSEFPKFYFLGRLASYRYFNMDQVIGQALSLATTFKTM